ncbi:MAG: VPLPA-CTERM sorting domain-containing protein [Tepidisphaeraceae bacterium]
MLCGFRKASIAACAAVLALGALPVSAVTIYNTSPVPIDGWDISWTTGVGLAINQDGSSSTQVDVEKTATFTAPNQGYQITFEPIQGYSGKSATQFVIPDETIANNTGASFNGFAFVLLPTVAGSTTFKSVARTFIPPTGPGYDYTTVSLTSGNTILAYTGTQKNGATSFWGNGDPSASGDNLLIDATPHDGFSLKELSSSGGGSTGPVVPLPAAAWQSLAGLAGLALIGVRRQMKHRRMA